MQENQNRFSACSHRLPSCKHNRACSSCIHTCTFHYCGCIRLYKQQPATFISLRRCSCTFTHADPFPHSSGCNLCSNIPNPSVVHPSQELHSCFSSVVAVPRITRGRFFCSWFCDPSILILLRFPYSSPPLHAFIPNQRPTFPSKISLSCSSFICLPDVHASKSVYNLITLKSENFSWIGFKTSVGANKQDKRLIYYIADYRSWQIGFCAVRFDHTNLPSLALPLNPFAA